MKKEEEKLEKELNKSHGKACTGKAAFYCTFGKVEKGVQVGFNIKTNKIKLKNKNVKTQTQKKNTHTHTYK